MTDPYDDENLPLLFDTIPNLGSINITETTEEEDEDDF